MDQMYVKYTNLANPVRNLCMQKVLAPPCYVKYTNLADMSSVPISAGQSRFRPKCPDVPPVGTKGTGPPLYG